MDIGFIGLGIMGTGMVRNLLKAGYGVTAWNRTARQLHPDLAQATLVRTIGEAVGDKAVILVCLTGPDAQRETLLGAKGVFASAKTGCIVADATTTDPKLTLELAAAARERGIRYLDTPVFGSKNEAWEGRLDFVCGGSRSDFEEIRPVLKPLAATVHYMGSSSKGASAKLVGNLLVAAQMVSLGEALALARKAGLDAEALMGYLDVTDFSSALIRGVGRATLAGDFEPSFYLRHMLKDARLIGDFAQSMAVAAPQAALIAELYQAAVNRGLGELNASGLHKMLFEMAGIE